MYFQNYDDYMRDVFYFNQMPNQNLNYPYMGYNNMQNPNFQNNFAGQNFNNGNSNINNMYPSIYRIVQPVVSRVLTGNNYQYMSEDNLNSMVDTVYNIVEGDARNNLDNSSSLNSNNTTSTQTQSQTQTQPQRNNTNQNTTQTTTMTQTSTSSQNNQNETMLLKDLIKILLIKEIINRNNIRRFSNNGFNNYQNIPNYYDQRYMF